MRGARAGLSHARVTHACARACAQVFLTSRYLAIAMEYVAGGDMFEYVVRKGGLKESEARWFFQQLIIGVDYLHRMVRATGAACAHVCFEALCWPGCPCAGQAAPVLAGQPGSLPGERGAERRCACAARRAWRAGTSSSKTRCWTAARGPC
jgi:hypothetical protein